MARSDNPEGFEDFLHWLERSQSAVPPQGAAQVQGAVQPQLSDPPAELTSAARGAWKEFQALHQDQRKALVARLQAGTYVEELELMAAADPERRWLPRLRTPNGFAISALYPTGDTAGVTPVGLLVECPADLIEVFAGQKVHIYAGSRWVEIGEIDAEGKATGDLPQGFDFVPPFAFRVGGVEEDPKELGDPEGST